MYTRSKTLAVDADGNMSWCSVPEDLRGSVRGCTHIGHQALGQSIESFMHDSQMINTANNIAIGFPPPMKREEDSEEFHQAKLDFNKEMNEYGMNRVHETLGDDSIDSFRSELSSHYGVSDEETQNKVLSLISMAQDQAYGKSLPSGGSLLSAWGGYRDEVGVLLQDVPKKLQDDLTAYAQYVSSDEGVIVIPKDLTSASELREMNPYLEKTVDIRSRFNIMKKAV